VGKILEYGGEGVKTLTVPERATIANMGAETGATTSVFPSDELTRDFLARQGREGDWRELAADPGAEYAGELVIDLAALEPLAACPHSPDAVRTVRELAGTPVGQVCIGSCTNSSLADLMTVAAVLKGKTVHPAVSLVISPGSRQVMEMMARSGALADLIAAGARILESACGPCIGMGQSPPSGAVSLRTYNRNFQGRSGTADAEVYLVSPQTAAAAARKGAIADPRELGDPPKIELPGRFAVDDSLILPPAGDPEKVEVVKGPNITAIPTGEPLAEEMTAAVWLVTGDNVTTDDIMPAGAKILPLRSNIGRISRFVFHSLDPGFVERTEYERRLGRSGVIVGGENYGQGSSREHAALAPYHLGVRAVIARSFARIHRSNLINFGILPLTPGEEEIAGKLETGDELKFPALRREVEEGSPVTVKNLTRGLELKLALDLSPRERELLLAGGLLRSLAG